MSFTHGLEFKKLDLQVHTPASECFVGEGVKPDAIVEEAIRKGLAGIAITDHNTGEWVDRVKAAAKGKPLVVFPGMDVLVPGGQSGIHVLAILDVDRTTKDVDQLSGALKLLTCSSALAGSFVVRSKRESAASGIARSTGSEHRE